MVLLFGIISGQTITVTEANNLHDNTNISSVTASISDNEASVLVGLSGTNNVYTIGINDANVSVADINTINNKTTGTLTVNSTTVTGSYSDLNDLYKNLTGLSGFGVKRGIRCFRQ